MVADLNKESLNECMEHVARELYCSPKCGLSFVHQIARDPRIGNASKPVLFVRNPYSRLVSYYVNKVVYCALPGDGCSVYRMVTMVEDPVRHGVAPVGVFHQYIALPDTARGIATWSFRQFVEWLEKQDPYDVERHLKPQFIWTGTHRPKLASTPAWYMEDYEVFQIEKLNEPETQERLGDVFCIGPKHGDRADRVQEIFYEARKRPINKTPRTKSCKHDVYDMTPSEMRSKKHIPKCVNKYYNKEIVSMVYNYYKQDFELYGYNKEIP